MRSVALHARRIAEQHVQGQIQRQVALRAIVHAQALLSRGVADHRIGTTLACAIALECRQALTRDAQHVALLRLVAPNLHGR